MEFGEDDYSDDDSLGSSAMSAGAKSIKSEEVLARKETRNVHLTKLIAFAVLFASAVAIACSVYFYTRRSEEAQFEQRFYDDAEKVIEAIGSSIEGSLEVLDTFAATAISSARSSNQSWPFVTIADFAIRASKTRASSDGLCIFFQPVVTPKEREQWEEYAWKNQGWVNETKKIQEKDTNYYGEVTYDIPAMRSIFNYTGDVPYEST